MAGYVEPNTDEVYSQMTIYDWDNDPEFQTGLRAILGSASSPEQIDRLTIRAKCFYYTRKFGTRVDFSSYQNWLESQDLSQPSNPTISNGEFHEQTLPTEAPPSQAQDLLMGGAPTPASFAEICELIAQGKEIPGIKEIPDTVLEGQASQANARTRKKPWETTAPTGGVQSSWST